MTDNTTLANVIGRESQNPRNPLKIFEMKYLDSGKRNFSHRVSIFFINLYLNFEERMWYSVVSQSGRLTSSRHTAASGPLIVKICSLLPEPRYPTCTSYKSPYVSLLPYSTFFNLMCSLSYISSLDCVCTCPLLL